MLRIAYIVPSLAPLGPVIVVRNLVERMVAHGHECVVFYFDEREKGMAFPCETRRISFCRREDFSGFDWVHVHCFRPMVYAARLKGGRKMVTMHSYLFTEYRYSLGRCLGWLFARFTMMVAAGYDQVAVLSYNGVDIQREPSEEVKAALAKDEPMVQAFKGEGTLIGCICELVKIKNLDTMVNALALLPKEYKLLLVGSGADEMVLKEQARQLGLEERVLFLGFCEEAHRLFPLVDIYAMTSRSEGFCLALVEAAMYGKRIVCADIPGMREKFSEEEVTYFDVDSPQELAEAVLTANEHPEKGERAKAVAEERFSAERMYEGYEGVYARKV